MQYTQHYPLQPASHHPHTPCHAPNCSFRQFLDSLTPRSLETVSQFLNEPQVDHVLEHLQKDNSKRNMQTNERDDEGGVMIPWDELTDGMERLAGSKGLGMHIQLRWGGGC
jgi:hypothetical protein